MVRLIAAILLILLSTACGNSPVSQPTITPPLVPTATLTPLQEERFLLWQQNGFKSASVTCGENKVSTSDIRTALELLDITIEECPQIIVAPGITIEFAFEIGAVTLECINCKYDGDLYYEVHGNIQKWVLQVVIQPTHDDPHLFVIPKEPSTGPTENNRA